MKGYYNNQCDGCKRGLELRNGLHYDYVRMDVRSVFIRAERVAVMGCTSHLYANPIPDIRGPTPGKPG